MVGVNDIKTMRSKVITDKKFKNYEATSHNHETKRKNMD